MESSNKKFILILFSCALFIGLIHSLPMIYVRCRLGSEYKGIFPLQSADEEHYDVSIKAAMDGYYYHKNNYLFEGRVARRGGIPPFSSEKILGFIGGKFGFSLSCWVFVMRFLFPALAFILLFALFRSFDISRYQSLFWAFFNLLSPYLLYGWYGVVTRPFFRVLRDRGLNALWYEQYAIATLPWARIANPQFSGLFFILALICLVKIIKGEKTWAWLIPFLFLGYVNFRLYFYFWSCLGALMALVIVFSLVYRKWRVLYPVGAVLFLGLLYGLPRIAPLLRSPTVGVISRFPIFSPGCLIAFILTLIGILRRKKWKLVPDDRFLFFIASVCVLVCMNQHVLTSKIVQPWHYELFVTPLLLSISLSILVNREDVLSRVCETLRKRLFQNHRFSLLISLSLFISLFVGGIIHFFYYFKLAPNYKDAMFYIILAASSVLSLIIYFRILLYLFVFSSLPIKRLAGFLGFGVLLIVIFQGLTRQSHISIRAKRRAETNQYLAAPFKWLRENTPPHSTVLASFHVSERIPLFTRNSVYLCKNAFHEYIPSEKERWERSLNYFILTGHDEKSFLKRLDVWPYGFLFWGLRSIDQNKNLYSFGRDSAVSDEMARQVLDLFREKQNENIHKILERFNLNYVFFGPEEKKYFKISPENLPRMSRVYQDETPVAIYKVNPLGF